MHLQQTANALALVLGAVVDVAASLQHTGVHTEEGQTANERIRCDLERQRRERRFVVHFAGLDHIVLALEMPLDGGHVVGGREEVDHSVEQRLHALVLERGAAENRHELHRNRGRADALTDFFVRELFAGEILLDEHVVVFHDHIDQRATRFLNTIFIISGNVDNLEGLAEVLVIEDVLLAFDDVDVAREELARTDRQLNRQRGLGQAVLNHLDAALKVGADAVHLVREDHTGHFVAISLTPHRLRLRLNAGHGVQQGHGAVEDAERALHFDGKVHVARGVDDVDAVFRPIALGIRLAVTHPEAGGGSGRDGDTTLLLLLHPVHRGCTIVHLADLVRLPRVIEDALGRRGLAGIDVGHDADIAIVLQVGRTWHRISKA